MFLRTTLCILALVFTSSSANAQPGRLKASARTASQVFWSFARCIVDREMASARTLLDKYKRDKAGWKAANAAAQNHYSCLPPGDELRMDENLFIGALAGAYIVKRYKGLPMPDYSGVPPIVDLKAAGPDAIAHAIFLSFGECVFRNRAEEVRSLFVTRPGTKEEAAAFDLVIPVLDACMPMQEGQQIKFTRIKLRSVLGEAAYKLDSKLPTS